MHLVGLGFEPFEEAPGAVPDLLFPLAFAVDDPLALLVGERVPRRVERDAALLRELHQVVLAFLVRLGLPGFDRAARERLGFVGHHEAVVDADDAAEAAAGFAGAHRRIEREQRGHRIAVRQIAFRAMQFARVFPALDVGLRRIALVDHVQVHAAAPDAQRRLDRLHDARALGGSEAQAVLDHFERVAMALVDARVALLLQQRADFGFLEVLRHDHREADVHARIAGRGGAARGVGVDAFGVVAAHGLAAVPAVQSGGAREQQLQVIVELGHRADGGARGAHRIRLVDGDGRRNAVDAVHRGLVHAIEELARVRREGLDVAPLALGVQRVEHQRGLARARHARHHHEFLQRNLEVEVLQIVLTRAANDDRRARSRLRPGGRRGGGLASSDRLIHVAQGNSDTRIGYCTDAVKGPGAESASRGVRRPESGKC